MTIKHMRDINPQCKLILNHLKKGHSITHRSAPLEYKKLVLRSSLMHLIGSNKE